MGISSYYEVVPTSLLEAIGGDEEVASAFDCLWGYGSGMHSWFAELGEEEIAEVTEYRNVPSRAVERLRDLLSRSEFYPGAYIEKTHHEHETMLRSAFAKAGAPDADQLARIAVLGERDWGHGTDLAVVTNDQCGLIANFASRFKVADVVRAFDLGDRTPEAAWREKLTSELQELVDCYCLAARLGHEVVTGVT